MNAESLISHLSCGLAPADRDAFRRAAELPWRPRRNVWIRVQFIAPSSRSGVSTSARRARTAHHMDQRPEAGEPAHRRAAEGQPRPSPRSDRAVSMGY